jgi:hypothetical protein
MVDNFQDHESMPPPMKRKLSTNSRAMLQRPSTSASNGAEDTSNEDHWYVTTDVKHTTSFYSTNTNALSFPMPPPLAILKHLIGVYFTNCHGQPYCFFHEATLRRQLLAGAVPHFLVLAIASSAVRYSMHEAYKNKQAAAIGAYTNASWSILLERYFASDNAPDIAMAQATALLATADFVGK